MIDGLPELGKPILVFSGGEPLMRPDLFELADYARNAGLPTALATNGTIMNEVVAQKIIDVGFRRISMSFDGPDAATHDGFRKINGAFDSSIAAFRLLKSMGMSLQINTTVARHNYLKLDAMYQLALDLGADALHIFMLVPVGCGMELTEEIMLQPEEYEKAMNWIYDRSLEGKLHLKATCAPHYFRSHAPTRQTASPANSHARRMPTPIKGMGPSARLFPRHSSGSPALRYSGGQGQGGGHGCGPSFLPCRHVRHDQRLPGRQACVLRLPRPAKSSPAGISPSPAATSRQIPLPTIWRDSQIFADIRDDSKLGRQVRHVRVQESLHGLPRPRLLPKPTSYLAEEPNCEYVPLRLRK